MRGIIVAVVLLVGCGGQASDSAHDSLVQEFCEMDYRCNPRTARSREECQAAEANTPTEDLETCFAYDTCEEWFACRVP